MLKWSSKWCLYFNTNKCNVLHSGEKNTDCDYFMSIGEVQSINQSIVFISIQNVNKVNKLI